MSVASELLWRGTFSLFVRFSVLWLYFLRLFYLFFLFFKVMFIFNVFFLFLRLFLYNYYFFKVILSVPLSPSSGSHMKFVIATKLP